MSLVIGTHFCGGDAVEVKAIIGGTHLGCAMSDQEESGNHSANDYGHDARYENVPCCENEFQTVQITDEYVNDVAPRFINVDYAEAILWMNPDLELFSKSSSQFYPDYIAPPLEKDVQVLFQTFLI